MKLSTYRKHRAFWEKVDKHPVLAIIVGSASLLVGYQAIATIAALWDICYAAQVLQYFSGAYLFHYLYF